MRSDSTAKIAGTLTEGVVIPTTHYVQSEGADIAYKVLGEGPRDIVLTIPWGSHLDMLWELPEWANAIQQMSRLGRLIIFDMRGSGLSSRDLTGITPERRSDDLIAIMDAADSLKAVLVGWVDSGAIALLTAARYPDRVSAVIAGESLAVGHRDQEHPFGVDDTIREMMREVIRSGGWGQGCYRRSWCLSWLVHRGKLRGGLGTRRWLPH